MKLKKIVDAYAAGQHHSIHAAPLKKDMKKRENKSSEEEEEEENNRKRRRALFKNKLFL